jgi:hypothetical protein
MDQVVGMMGELELAQLLAPPDVVEKTSESLDLDSDSR